jgi:uncharacterized protein (UPF0276 family)
MGVIPVGAGYRPELNGLFRTGTREVECAELIANRYFAAGGVSRPWELAEIAGMPIVVHGLSGNVASTIGPSREYLEQIKVVADYTDAFIYSDHLAFTASRDRSLGHLAPNLFDDDLLDHACRHIETMVEVTGRRICLENLATKTTISGSKYTPEEFYLRLLEKSDAWDCHLDLTNIWINSQNRPVDAVEFVTSIPRERIRYVHLAGGRWIHGELIDSHSEAVHPEAFELLGLLLATAEPEVVIVERDSNWEHAYQEVSADLATARRIVAEARLQSRPHVRSA